MDEVLREFLAETNESLEVADSELVTFEQEPGNAEALNSIFRLLHTIKGTCGFIGLQRLATLSHAAETLMDKLRRGTPVMPEAVSLILLTVDRIKDILASIEESGGSEPEGSDADLIGPLETMAGCKLEVPEHAYAERLTMADAARSISSLSVRVDLDLLEQLSSMTSGLSLTHNQLDEIARRDGNPDLTIPLQRLATLTASIQDAVIRARMQPMGHAWRKLPRIVRGLAQHLGKRIELVMIGGDTQVDRQVLDLIKDPLIHLARNSADHGLEGPDERRRTGKSETGRIWLSAYREGDHVFVEIADDGRGLNRERIGQKALESALATPAELARMPEARLYRFIFRPGFSTADTITSISGRGVGLDVVRANVAMMGGTVDVRSRPGRGTTFRMSIPLSLAPRSKQP